MQAFVGTQFVKITLASTPVSSVSTHSENRSSSDKKFGERFLAALLSCLSAWGT